MKSFFSRCCAVLCLLATWSTTAYANEGNSALPLYEPIAQVEARVRGSLARKGELGVEAYLKITPTTNAFKGLTPLVAAGVGLGDNHCLFIPTVGFVAGLPEIPIAPLVGFYTTCGTSIRHNPQHHNHGAHVTATLESVFDPKNGLTDTELTVIAGPKNSFGFGGMVRAEGVMKPDALNFMAGPLGEIHVFGKPHHYGPVLGYGYLAGLCGGKPCHGPFANLTVINFM